MGLVHQVGLERGILALLCVHFLLAFLLLRGLLLLEGLRRLVQLFEGGRLPSLRRQEPRSLAQLRAGCLPDLLNFLLLVCLAFGLLLCSLLHLLLVVPLHEVVDPGLLRSLVGERRRGTPVLTSWPLHVALEQILQLPVLGQLARKGADDWLVVRSVEFLLSFHDLLLPIDHSDHGVVVEQLVRRHVFRQFGADPSLRL